MSLKQALSFVKLNFKETLPFLEKMIKSRFLTFAIGRIDNLDFSCRISTPWIKCLEQMSDLQTSILCRSWTSQKLNISLGSTLSIADMNNSIQNWVVWRTNSVLDGIFRKKKLFLTRNELIRPFVCFVQFYQNLCFHNRPTKGGEISDLLIKLRFSGQN